MTKENFYRKPIAIACAIICVSLVAGLAIKEFTAVDYPIHENEKLTFELRLGKMRRLERIPYFCSLPETPKRYSEGTGPDPEKIRTHFGVEFAVTDARQDVERFRFRLMQVGKVIPAKTCLSQGFVNALSDVACVIDVRPSWRDSHEIVLLVYANAYNREIARLTGNDRSCQNP